MDSFVIIEIIILPMKYRLLFISAFLAFYLVSSVSAQETDQKNVSDNAALHRKLDSLTTKVDSILMDQYDIKKDTTKDGLLIHNAIAIKASSLGLGFESILSVHAKINIRLSLSYFKISGAEQFYSETVEYDLTHENIIGGAYIFVDYQFHKFFHATAGIIYRVDKESGSAHPVSGITIGGIEIPAEVIGNISYAIEKNAFAPYLGIGIGRSISLKKKISFSADFGVYYTKALKVDINATGMLTPTASDLNKNQIINNVDVSGFWPYGSIQLSYRIF